jgi:hypothetical protein
MPPPDKACLSHTISRLKPLAIGEAELSVRLSSVWEAPPNVLLFIAAQLVGAGAAGVFPSVVLNKPGCKGPMKTLSAGRTSMSDGPRPAHFAFGIFGGQRGIAKNTCRHMFFVLGLKALGSLATRAPKIGLSPILSNKGPSTSL